MVSQVRCAIPSDAEALTSIATRAYSPYLPHLDGVRPAPLDADYGQAIAEREVWVSETDDGTVSGFVVLETHDDHCLLENVAVDPDYQGEGIGNVLLAVAEDRATAAGSACLRLYTNVVITANQSWYERHGFHETDRRGDGGFERVFYEKRLR